MLLDSTHIHKSHNFSIKLKCNKIFLWKEKKIKITVSLIAFLTFLIPEIEILLGFFGKNALLPNRQNGQVQDYFGLNLEFSK